MSAPYRVRQFIRAIGARIRPQGVNPALVNRYLPLAARSLFQAMPRYDQRHALGVLRTLQERGYDDRDLLAAALLHDVAKTADRAAVLRLWHRVAVVLMQALRPSLPDRIARNQPGSWRQPFYVAQRHPELGARLALEAGCSPQTAELIRRHEDRPTGSDDPWLAALRAADEVN